MAVAPTNPVATTAAEQDHSDPGAFAGEDADAPQDCGRSADDSGGLHVDEAAR